MIRYFAGHPTAANLMMAAILIMGAVSMLSLKRETFPDIPPDEIQVAIAYPGAAAGDVEEAICRRIEDAVDKVTDVGEVRCEAHESIATAIVEMREGGNFDGLLAEVKTEIDAIDDFPAEVETPSVRQLGRTDFVASMAVAGPMGASDLKAYAESLKVRLRRIDGVSGVDLKGFSDHQIRVEIRAQTMRRYGLSVADIARTVGRQSVDRPAGTIEGASRDVLLRFDDARRSAAELRDLFVVGGIGGAAIRLGDIARVSDLFEKPEESILFNGQRAAVMIINKGKTADTLDVIGAIKQFVSDERARAPTEVQIAVTQDIASIVRDRLNMLVRNGASGLVLVLITLTLFFSFRFSFWVAVGLPVSFAGAIFGMSLIGYSFDMITMVALLIAIGILVDDAIVISENIATHYRNGKSRLDAAVDGTREVMPGVLASFATTVVVFGPLAFLSGDIGSILKVLPVVLILTLAVSLAEAFLILPNHLGHSLAARGGGMGVALRDRVDGAVTWLRERVVGPLVDAAVAWRYLTVGVAVMLVLGSVAMVAGGGLKFRAFPDLDGDVAEARILMPQGTPLARTRDAVGHVIAALRRVEGGSAPENPGDSPLVRNVSVHFAKNIDAFETGPHVATVSVDLLSAELRAVTMDEFLAKWRAETGAIEDAVSLKFTDFTLGPGGLAIHIRLMGDDLTRLGAAARDLKNWLAAYHGVVDLDDDLRPGKPEMRVALRERALALGLEAETIASQLRAAFFGRTAAEIQVGPESYEIDVRLDARDRDSLDDLRSFTIITGDGGVVPLGAVVTLRHDRGFARINRVDGLRTVTLRGDVDSARANAADILGDMRARFLPDLLARYPGLSVDFEGQAKEGSTAQKSMMRGFGLGLVCVFLLLGFLFRSYVEPLAVIVAIPMALIGVVWGHVLMGLDLSMPSMMGFVSLAGVVVNNSILLVLFIRLASADGEPVDDAVRAAPRRRFRAIVLTSLTPVMGMLPLLSETSLQAQVLKPLITSLVFGMVSSTVMVLFLVPAAYRIIHDFRHERPGRETGRESGVGAAAPV